MSDAQEGTAAPATTPTEGPREIHVHPMPAVDASQQEPKVEAKQEIQPEVKEGDEPTETEKHERDEQGRFQKKEGVQPRIDELTRARREAEREATYWRQVAEQGKAQSSAEAAPTEPTPDKFEDYGEYVKALVKWNTEQTLAKQQAENSTRKVAETRTHAFTERLNEARTRITDFDAVVGASDVPLSPHVGEILQESEKGADLAYHFAKNPGMLQRLNGMSERAAAMEIGRIEASMTKAPAPSAKKISNAPTPANTGNSAGRSTTPDLTNMSMDEYKAARAKQGARWAR